uniref:Uncharacterized protein n=1 Tax=Strongyloides stercoralis TaxID=6248 RepID=A0A0K0E4M2_STRER
MSTPKKREIKTEHKQRNYRTKSLLIFEAGLLNTIVVDSFCILQQQTYYCNAYRKSRIYVHDFILFLSLTFIYFHCFCI